MQFATGYPLVSTATGGKKGGRATLTTFGHDLVALYRSAERDCQDVIDALIANLGNIDSL